MKKIRRFLISEKTVLFFILLNSVAIFFMTMLRPESFWVKIFAQADILCAYYFFLEAAIKIHFFGWQRYWQNGWNKFDFLIVVFSLPMLAAPFAEMKGLEIVLLLRLTRLFRLFRVLHFIPNLEHLAQGILRALKASVGVFLAIIIINIIFALGGTILFADLAPEHFGNPFLSIYSTFKVFTVEGWYEIPDIIAQKSNSDIVAVFVRIYFVITVFIGGILGLSMANAVFVDEMTQDNTNDLETKILDLSEQIADIKKVLEKMSANEKN